LVQKIAKDFEANIVTTQRRQNPKRNEKEEVATARREWRNHWSAEERLRRWEVGNGRPKYIREGKGSDRGGGNTLAKAANMPRMESGRATASWRGEMKGGSNQREILRHWDSMSTLWCEEFSKFSICHRWSWGSRKESVERVSREEGWWGASPPMISMLLPCWERFRACLTFCEEVERG
jgi:hypothetical protein